MAVTAVENAMLEVEPEVAETCGCVISCHRHTGATLACLLGCIIVDRLRYDTRCYFNVRSKADISQLNLPHGTDN